MLPTHTLQDQLVVDLRGMIQGLRQDNRQLATALQQLSSGAEVAGVLQALDPQLLEDALTAAPPRTAPAAVQGRSNRLGHIRSPSTGNKASVSLCRPPAGCRLG